MVKQVQQSQHQGTSQQVQRSNETPQPYVSPNLVDSVGSIPSQLYHRLGLTMPRWLFWILTIVMGITLSGLLVSTLALWTPLWSTLGQSDEDLAWSGKESEKIPSANEVWNNISQYKLTRPINILVMGIEPVKGTVDGSPESFAGKSDTMLLVRLNPENKTIRVLSIPRDTMIAIPEKGLNKVSDANAQGGPALALRVISRTLNNVPIDRYIRISTSGLRQLVDQVGGVEVFVPETMNYKDMAGQFSIDLVSGWQNLNGEQAEQFIRFREANMGDLQRVQRQQSLLVGLRERMFSPTVLPRLPQLIRVMNKYFDSNLKLEEMMAIANFSLSIERDKFQMTMLPGIFSRMSQDPNSYWLDLTGKGELLNDYVGVNLAGLKPDGRSLATMKIAVQNSGNNSQVRETVLNQLKQKGLTKVYPIADWKDDRSETKIIVQKGNLQAAEELQKILGLGAIEVSSTGDLESDITIRIGKDWK
ncbi:LCP family protein [Calothrix sp. 336/3]|uniref:LCP family protein n=1 Tax=Calothrix sp. 336/3 TaxID=1337936 RepID=UPI0004E36B5E|nr:LCP family protein [Calothrix sp. 336/3]AKG22613.1 transcriptional regulator [Calothrix sp. 336/3]